MKILKTMVLCIAAAMALPVGTAYADDVMFKGDINNDNVLNISDILTLRNYLHGKSELTFEQYQTADVNNDSSVDAVDLAGLRSMVIANVGKMPVGTWIMHGSAGREYWYFDGNGSLTATDEQSGAVTEYTVSVQGGKMSFAGNDGSREFNVSWVNNDLFTIVNEGGMNEDVSYYGSKPVQYDQLLNGTWIADSGKAYHIKGVYGYYDRSDSDVTGSFWYEKDLNRLTFHFAEGAQSAFIAPVDSMHIDITWDDGTVERFTKRNIEVIDGITYVNGILIANKTYDLPSSYNPNGILPEAMTAFNEMKAAAWNNNRLSLDICSGFRSYSYQGMLYNNYVNRDGKAAADTYSARPGHSEHQTGLAMDINYAGSSFDTTPEAKWLAAHCAEYGFIIRYPQGKQDITGYKYESWHIRYLGKELAKEVTDSGLTLEEFLCIDSVYKY